MLPLEFSRCPWRTREALHHHHSRWEGGGWRTSAGRLHPWLHADPPAEFITRGLWHALDGEWYGHVYSLQEAKDAGYTTCGCTGYSGCMTVSQMVEAGESVGIKVIPILPERYPPVSDVEAYDASPAVQAWYVYDEPSLDQLPTFEERQRTWKVGKPMLMAAARASYEEYRQRWLWCVTSSEIACHSNHYYRWGTWPRAWCFHAPSVDRPTRYPSLTKQTAASWLHRDSTMGVNLPLGQAVAEAAGKPHWFITQAHGSWNAEVNDWLMVQPWDFPCRAQTVYALASGCTGFFHFAYDSWFFRNANQYGIASDPPLDYGSGGIVVSTAQQTHMRELWVAMAELNTKVAGLEPVLLSRSSTLEYEVEFQNETYTWADDPIRANCREQGGRYWFLVVNIENFPHPTRLRLPFVPASVSRYYAPEVVETVNGNVISFTLPPWGIWIGSVPIPSSP